ncbi:MAG: hypothetical protein IKO39_10970 [Treponema sp.]|nr:hypothetical protein [Treponema sp.]
MMKISKLLKVGAFALLAASLCFVGCKNEEDDPEGAITGSNNDYAVNYDNTNGYSADTVEDTKSAGQKGVYRAWNRTTWKHQGALTKITLKKGNGAAGRNDGVMGVAWDLQTATGADATSDSTAETFNVFGVRNYEGTLQCYVSRFFNITNKQANNFGATTLSSKGENVTISSTPDSATEWDVSNGFQTLESSVSGDEITIWVDVFAKLSNTDSNDDAEGTVLSKKQSKYNSAEAGSWIIVFYNADPTLETTTDSNVLKTFVIPAKTSSSIGSGYDSTMTSETQKKQAVYANIYKGGHLVGAWNYAKTYHNDEVVEE